MTSPAPASCIKVIAALTESCLAPSAFASVKPGVPSRRPRTSYLAQMLHGLRPA